MIFSRNNKKQIKNLKDENAMLRSALEVILLEIENARPASAKTYALKALRDNRHGKISQEEQEERERKQDDFFNSAGGRLLVAQVG